MNDPKKKNKVRVDVPRAVSASVDYLVQNAGYANRADVIRTAVRMLMNKEFPRYVARRIDSAFALEQAPDELPESTGLPRKMPRNKEQVKREVDISRGTMICEQLGGTIESPNGIPVCRWTTYEYMNPHYVAEQETVLSVENLTEDLIAHQYIPDYETVSKVINNI